MKDRQGKARKAPRANKARVSDKSYRAGPKRTPTERERELETIARLDARGYSQREIAAELGSVSQPQISKDLAELRRRYLQGSGQVTAENLERTLASLREIRREAWRAWERSKKDAERRKAVTDGRIDGTGKLAAGAKTRTERVAEGQCGDAGYLRVVFDCEREMARLQNLYPARRLEHSGPGGKAIPLSFNPEGMTDEELDRAIDLERVASAAAAADTGPDPA